MRATKFVRLLQTFDQGTLRNFDRWLRSPWCNTNQSLVRLLEKIQLYHPHYDTPKLSKEKLFRQVLPKGKYSDRRMNNLLSEGYLAARKFLVFQRFSEHQGLQKQLLIAELQSRYLDDWFFREIQQEIQHLEAKEVREWEEELDLFRLYRRLYHHPHQEPRMQVGRNTIVRMGQQLQLVYLLEKGAIINEKLWRNQILQEENHAVAIEIESWQQLSATLSHPALDLYRLRFADGGDDPIRRYQQLRQTLLDHFEQLNKKEQKLQLLSLLNDTIQMVKRGQLALTDSLALYQLGLKSGSLLNQGKLTRSTFTSIVITSNTNASYEFTNQFIEDYIDDVDEKIRNDCYYWAKAHTAYWQQNLEECLAIFQSYTFEVPHFQLISRVLWAQLYFDLYLQDHSYFTVLFSHLDAFEKWLKRERTWSNKNKMAFVRFVQKCRALAKWHSNPDDSTEHLRTLLQDLPPTQALHWLSQKQEEILHLRAPASTKNEAGASQV